MSGEDIYNLQNIIEGFDKLEDRKARLCNIIDPSNKDVIDNAIVLIFFAPNSYTGENVVEISLHGGSFILTKTLSMLSENCSARLAKPGEFTRRAFLNGKIDLTSAEGVNAMIVAETKTQHWIANSLYSGKVRNVYQEWRRNIIDLQSYIEALIDFPDENLPDNITQQLYPLIENLKNSFTKQLGNFKICTAISTGIKIPILGIPNVGKSSIINEITKQDISIVTDIPGTTRDAIKASLKINEYLVHIVDTAGIRNTEDIIEKEGVKKSLKHSEEADFSIIVFDASKDIQNQIDELSKSIEIKNSDILVFNKIDIIKNNTSFSYKDFIKNNINQELQKKLMFFTSTISSENIDSLIKGIGDKVAEFNPTNFTPLIISDRHKEAISSCLHTLENLNIEGSDLEIVSENLRQILVNLESIIGNVSNEDLLDNIFGKFCIGK